MDYIYVGRISTTHGLKGEIKIRSNFKYKEQVFKINNKIYLGKEKEEFEIISYRKHKEYDMVILKGLDDIDKVIKYKGTLVFCNKNLIHLENDYLKEDLIGLSAYFNNENLGIITDVIDQGNGNETIIINKIIIPKNSHFIEKVDLKERKIFFKNIEGLV